MKQVLILYSQYSSPSMLKRSEDLFSSMAKRGVLLCRGFIPDYDIKNKVFTKALFLENGAWVWKQHVTPDTVYDRSFFYLSDKKQEIRQGIAKSFSFFNSLRLGELMSNKWKTYLAFRQFCPPTMLIDNHKDFEKISQLSTEKIILKPLAGSGGNGIKIYPWEKARPLPFPFIAQNLISTTGIKGIVKGPHDLRVLLADEDIFHSFIRIPKKGKLIANLSHGSTIRRISPSRLPDQVLSLVKQVKHILGTREKKLYSIDIMLDSSQKPWIIELNSRPGLILEDGEGGARTNYYNHLANFFLKG